jgi:hypothetical protein
MSAEQRQAGYLPDGPSPDRRPALGYLTWDRIMQEYEDYAALACQADRAAVTATSRVAKTCWKALAEEYRKLAARQSQPRQSDRDAKGPEHQD